MINYQNLIFSFKLSQQRMDQSENIIENSTLNRIMCFSLYNLGVNRKNISTALNMPPGTVKSTIRAINQGGIAAFNDRRKTNTRVLPSPPPTSHKAIVKIGGQSTIITIGHSEIKIPNGNPLQLKVFLLTLINNNMLKKSDVAKILKISNAHVSNLSKGLDENDILSLIDKRKGQQKDYVFNEEVKSELIQQFVANIVSGNSISSNNIASQVNAACNANVSDRSVRQHISKLGLNKIKKSLPKLLVDIKKNLIA
ncbi:hypothetical protein MHK_003483 [Candidatus Magnetomorum sp. HK-1]|nr:hypothetical protein MHK_003483 [Candidatus Magnetomorum sp. HK-1]